LRHQCTAAVNSTLRSCNGASNRHRVPRLRLRLRLRAKATAVGCWAKPRSASCHVVAAFEQPLMSNSRLKQAGRPVRATPWTSMPRRRSRRGLPGQEGSRRTVRGSFGSSVQPNHELAQPPHPSRQQCEPVVRRGKQPPPLSRPKAPASAPAPFRMRRQLRSQTKAGILSAPVAGLGVRRA
jgi:hypothetical protein